MSDSSGDERSRRRRDRNDESGFSHRSDRRHQSDSTSKNQSSAHKSRRHEDQRDSRRRHDDNHGSTRKDRSYRERSRSRERPDRRPRSRSPPVKRRRRSSSNHEQSPRPERRSRAPLPSQDESFRGGNKDVVADGPVVEKQKPNYKPTGLLAKEANTVAGSNTVLKYHEPPEARKPPPKEQWRMYVFKDKDLLDTVYLHERSVWLVGRDRTVTDLYLEHPSISKQHAVIQFRSLTSTNEFGDKTTRVRPYLIDLESANGTKLNFKAVEVSRYVELVDGDVVGFGHSEREYVLMLPPADK